MLDSLRRLASDPSLRERTVALDGLVAREAVPPIEAMFHHFRRFTVARRREARVAWLEKAGRDTWNDWRLDREGVATVVSGFSAGMV